MNGAATKAASQHAALKAHKQPISASKDRRRTRQCMCTTHRGGVHQKSFYNIVAAVNMTNLGTPRHTSNTYHGPGANRVDTLALPGLLLDRRRHSQPNHNHCTNLRQTGTHKRRNSNVTLQLVQNQAAIFQDMSERRYKQSNSQSNKAIPMARKHSDTIEHEIQAVSAAGPSGRRGRGRTKQRRPVTRSNRQVGMAGSEAMEEKPLSGLAKPPSQPSPGRRRKRRRSNDSTNSDDDDYAEGTELLIKIGRAFLARIIFVSHSLITIWVTVKTYDNATYWGFALISIGILLEGGYTIVMRAGDERKWLLILFTEFNFGIM